MTDYIWHDDDYNKRIQLTIDSDKIGSLVGPYTGYAATDAYNNHTARLVIPASRVGYNASTIQLKLSGYVSWTFDKMYIGHQALGGDLYDFDGNQVQVTFDGSAGDTVPIGTGLWSDPINIDITAGKSLVLSVYMSGSVSAPRQSVDGFVRYYKSGDDAATTNATGYTSGNYLQFIEDIVSISGTGYVENFPVLIHLSDSSGIANTDVTDVFDELTVTGGVVLESTFSGAVLDTNIWAINTESNASVTVNNALELNNQTGDAHSGSQCYTKDSFVKEGVYIFSMKWKASIDDHYDAGIGPHIMFCNPSATRDTTYYGTRDQKYACVLLCQAGAFTTERTQLRIADRGTGAQAVRNTQAISIDESLWHDLEITLDCNNAKITVDLNNGTYNFDATIDSTSWASIGSTFVMEFGTSEYNKNNTERFKDLIVTGTEDNEKNISVYTTSGVQDVQCYTEIEKWDSSNEEAWLWVKMPEVNAESDTILYLYYDKDVSDNTSYVGDTGDYAAKQVWDSNFVGVWHMAQDPAGGDILDSTSYANDGTPAGSMTSDDLVSAKIGEGIDFDGSNDYLDCGKDAELDITEAITLEAVFKYTTGGNYRRLIAKQYGGAGTINSCYQLGMINTNTARFSAGTIFDLYGYGANVNDGAWHHFVGTYDSSQSDLMMMLDSSVLHTSSSYSTAIRSNIIKLLEIAGEEGSSLYRYNDVIDEVRISNILRPETWIHLTYSSNWDDLITFGSEEPKPSFVFNGYVQVLGSPSAREVYLYHRSTGELVGSATSSPSTGYFEIPTPFNDYHFVNILPELDEDYNIIVQDKIKYGS